MVFYYFLLLLFSFCLFPAHLTAAFACFLTSLWTWWYSDCVWCCLIGSQFVFRGRRGLLDIAGHLEARFLMFFRHTASKFTGTVKLRLLIGLLSLSKDSSTGVESIYWLKCVLLRYDGWPHAPFQLVSSRPFSRWPFASQTQSQSACSISRQTGHVSTTK